MTVLDVVAVPGSLRRDSFNRRLCHHAAAVAPEGMAVEVADLARLPLFDEDVEAQGDPPGVAAMKERLRAADGVILATPEYNLGVAAPMKNLVDWASRPPGRGPLNGKPVLLMGASTGRLGGTVTAQSQLRTSLAVNAALVMPAPFVLVAEAASRFDDQGLAHEGTDKVLRLALAAFRDWIERHRG